MYQKLSPAHSPPAMEFVLSTEGGNPTESHLEGLLSRITLSTICHSPGFQKTACVRAHLLSLTLVTPRTVARQASLSMGFPRQKYWSELPFPLQGIFPTQGSNPRLLGLLHCRQILYPGINCTYTLKEHNSIIIQGH